MADNAASRRKPGNRGMALLLVVSVIALLSVVIINFSRSMQLAVEDASQVLGHVDVAAGTGDGGQRVNCAGHLGTEGIQVGTGLLQQGPGRAALLLQQGAEQVYGLDIVVVLAQGQ